MVFAQRVQSGLVHSLRYVVGDDQVQHLGMEHVIHIEHHLGKHPIVGLIKGSVDEVGPGVGLDRKR